MKLKIILLAFLGILNVHAQTAKKPVTTKKTTSTVKTTPKAPAVIEGIFATISTNKGDIVVQLEYKKTPVTVANFISLAEAKNTFVTNEKLIGKPFYDGLKFHRVIADFMIQGGDPYGNGSGGPGYSFKDEFTDLTFNKGGILAMANSGPATNGSQFFITHKDTQWLNGKHTIFGHVVKGMDIVNKIAQDDVITKVIITRKGTLAKKFDAAKIFSDYYANKAEDAKIQAALTEQNRAKQAALDAEAKKAYTLKYAPVMAAKVASFEKLKMTATKTESGLAYVLTKGTGAKPVNGSTVYVHYAGYFEDGSLFDSSYQEINKTYGKFDANRANQNGYQAMPFQCGRKDGLIPGFIEGLETMSVGDKATLFIPSKLGWGERGYSPLIPPNTNVIFEVELFDTMPTAKL